MALEARGLPITEEPHMPLDGAQDMPYGVAQDRFGACAQPQSLATEYAAIRRSWVTIVRCSSRAWATRSRSNGSR